jgi:acetyl-CoA C-acetyltransferase
MVETAENLRAQYGIGRQEQDELAARSHERAVAAQESGAFADEIVPVTVPAGRRTPETVVDRDEHPRADTTPESLAALRPLRLRTTTRRPSRPATPAAERRRRDVPRHHRDEAERAGLTPVLALRSWAVAGVGPGGHGHRSRARDGGGPRARRARLADMDVIELNEAFAARCWPSCASGSSTPADERLNPLGSGISLGHPVGATGARILATMAHEMKRRGSRYGLETMCIGGGQGLAAVFEAVR